VNGAHDLGGMHGFGRVDIERDEPVFHSAWERRAFAITLAAGFLGKWNIDMSRYAREQMPPAEYLATGYYEHWLFGLEKLLHDHGLVPRQELDARMRSAHTSPAPIAGVRILAARDVEAALRKSRASKADEDVPPRYKVGDRVVTKNIHPTGHTRLPRYARGKRGFVERVHGAHVFRDSAAAGQGENPQWLYTVRFSGPELWGEEADPSLVVSIDAWESYLEPA
jgi:nitrile hydratase subunit beta